MRPDLPEDDRVDVKPVEVLVVAVSDEQDLILGRHEIVAAHARRGLHVILDLSDLEPWQGLDLSSVLRDLHATTSGNSQHLVLMGDGDDAAVPAFPDLSAALAHVAKPSGSAFGLTATVPARIAYVQHLRQHVVTAVRECHGEREAFQVELLVDELAVNAVENSPSSRSFWELRFALEHHQLLVEVTNDFDDLVDSARIMNRRLASFDDSGGYMGERGRGLFLVARMADGLQIRALEGDRVRVTVTKRLGRS